MQRTANMLNVMEADGEHPTVFTNAGTDRSHYIPTWKHRYATSVSYICWPCAFSLVTHTGLCLLDRDTVTYLHRIFQRVLKHAYLAENTKPALGPMPLSILNLKFSPTTKTKQKNPATMPDFHKLLHSIVARWTKHLQ